MKWFTAEQLNFWGRGKQAQSETPTWVEALIRATAPEISAIRFLGGASSNLRGFDGILTAAGMPPYVPEGQSVWEFGAGDTSMVAKASSDLKTRTADTRGLDPKETTFVFVTPRNWDPPKLSREEWAAEQSETKEWKEVRVYDSVVLADWFAQRPAVAARFARLVGKRPAGVWTTEEFWSDFTADFAFGIKEKTFLCEKDELAKELVAQLANGPLGLRLRADSHDEVAAFAVAAIREAEPDVRSYIEDRTLIVDTEDAALELEYMDSLSVILRRQAIQRSAQLQRRYPTLIPIANDQQLPDLRVLTRPSARAFQETLEQSGIKPEEAQQLTHRCGRSITILRRTAPAAAPHKPEWATSGRDLIPALLACGWDSAVIGDRAIIEKLAASAYDDFERVAVKYVKTADPPIDRAGTMWALRAPADVLAQIGALVTDADLDLLIAAATTVFSEIDPALDDPPDEPFHRAGRRKHSDSLRRGLSTSLLQLAYFNNRLILGATRDTRKMVEQLFRDLPGLAADYRLLASLRDELPYLAEAAPHAFLTALERLLKGNAGLSGQFLTERGTFSPRTFHTGVLWALETLAWSPEHLPRVANILAGLAAVDPGGRLTNRPINSLRSILLPWRAGTNASLARRIEVIDQIRKSHSQVAWDLLALLLPKNQDSASEPPHARFKDMGASERPTITRKFVAELNHAIIARARDEASTKAERWVAIIKQLHAMDRPSLEETLTALTGLPPSLEESEKEGIWSELRAQVSRHRKYASAPWAYPPELLARIDALTTQFEPADPLRRIGWLFNDHFPDLAERSDSPAEAADAKRVEAVRATFASQGLDALVDLARGVKFPGLVGRAIYLSGVPLDDIDVRFVAWSADAALRPMAVGYAAAAERDQGAVWVEHVGRLVQEGRVSEDVLADCALSWRDTLANWEALRDVSETAATTYWSKTQWPYAENVEAGEYASDALLGVGRGVTAFAVLHRFLKDHDTPRLVAATQAALDQLLRNADANEQLTNHFIQETFAELRSRNDAEIDDLLKLEWGLLPLLDYGEDGALLLHQRMADSPEFFVSTLALIYKPKEGGETDADDSEDVEHGGEEADSVDDEEPTQTEKNIAGQAYRLMINFQTFPGSKDTIDHDALKSWAEAVRTLGAERKLTKVTDAYIGHLLAHSPKDPDDDAWPHTSVRRLLEHLGSSEIERGLTIERYNTRGVTTHGMTDGGRPERDLAEEYRQWAKTASAYERTAHLLSSIAKQWDAEAEEADIRAEQTRLRYNL